MGKVLLWVVPAGQESLPQFWCALNIPKEEIMDVPKYAASTPRALLVQFICRSCGKSRYGKVSKPSWTAQGVGMDDPGQFVKCLHCGVKQFDSYNWARV